MRCKRGGPGVVWSLADRRLAAQRRGGLVLKALSSFPATLLLGMGVGRKKMAPPLAAKHPGRLDPTAKLRGCCERSCRGARRSQLQCEQCS